jgi:hypothetical protein
MPSITQAAPPDVRLLPAGDRIPAGDKIPTTMDPTASHPPTLKIYLALNAAALLAAGVLMLLLSRSGGHSSLRLILITGTLLLAAASAGAAILLQLQPQKEIALYAAVFKSNLTRWLKPVLSALFLLSWYLVWFPPQYTGDAYYYYFIGLHPLILWGMLASGVALVFIMAGADGQAGALWRSYLRDRRATYYIALIALGGFALIALLTFKLKILAATEPFWQGAGVPLLASQVFIAVIIAVVALNLEARLARVRIPLDLLLFLLIWAVSAVLWAAQPVPESFWVTGPRPPNQEYYPFSDLATFDLGSQFALIGQGIFNHMFFDRGLYMAFLVYLHAVGGQNYQALMSLQAAIFAIFPALLYLIGKKLHSRNAGLVLAALTIMRGLNSLTAAAWIDTATFKHMLTDFPTAIGLAVFVLLVLNWLESPGPRASHAVWAAGVLGLTSLLRPHVALLLPAMGLLALWIYRSKLGRDLMIAGLMLAGFLAGVAPWLIFGPSSGSILLLYGERIRAVIAVRYPHILPPAPASATLTPGALPQPSGAAQTPGTELQPPSSTAVLPSGSGPIPFGAAHYLHNLVTSALILPDSPEFLAVKEIIKGDEGFWRSRWDGGMSPIAAGMLILGLVLVALGLGASAHRLAWRGLVPLAVLLIYHVVNSLARTSGGRYLVPTDWIVICYFGVGLAEVLQLGSTLVRRESAALAISAPIPAALGPLLSWPRAFGVVAQLALIGALVPLAGALYPLRYPPTDAAALLKRIEPYLTDLGQSTSKVDAFLQQPGAVLLYGRALYPRFYPQGGGEPTLNVPFATRDYPRTVFILIGPHGYVYALLPGEAPKVLPNATDAIVLGCTFRQAGFDMLSAVAVVLPEQRLSIARSPAAPLTCPLPEPVCDNNTNCQ